MAEPDKSISLGDSFRQSRKEFWFMVGTWIAFGAWTGIYNGLFAAKSGEEMDLLFGMPRWVFIGVAAPWGIALAVTIWFALCFMKDTPLGADENDKNEPGGEQ